MDEAERERLRALLASIVDLDLDDWRTQRVEITTEYAREIEIVFAEGRFWITIRNTADGSEMCVRLNQEQARRMALGLIPPVS